jgi:predicted DNA-binding ribbon-helix-helix protein
MCRLFIGAEPGLWAIRTKSLRIDGVATSIRIEEFFWSVLDEIAARDCMTVNQLISRLYLEALDADHDMGNFTSFLRVCCGRYLALIGAGDLSGHLQDGIRVAPAEAILAREATRRTTRQAEMLRMPRRRLQM